MRAISLVTLHEKKVCCLDGLKSRSWQQPFEWPEGRFLPRFTRGNERNHPPLIDIAAKLLVDAGVAELVPAVVFHRSESVGQRQGE